MFSNRRLTIAKNKKEQNLHYCGHFCITNVSEQNQCYKIIFCSSYRRLDETFFYKTSDGRMIKLNDRHFELQQAIKHTASHKTTSLYMYKNTVHYVYIQMKLLLEFYCYAFMYNFENFWCSYLANASTYYYFSQPPNEKG